ncbi:alpha/beta hydrolase [Saccharopolyspora sp. ID03-671]|uniref:alpha/beta hydrolase fold domain-containing protein n=1 Tax=Saccharopolyspora sp. ID03-671 TaxID=3073066 RepID=UPI003255686F
MAGLPRRPADAQPQGTVVYVHGGGWVNEISAAHWRLVAQIAAEARTTVVVPIYPLVPFGTAEAVVTAVVDLVREAGELHGEARLAGDSDGGQVALSAAMVLRDQHGGTLPRTLLISPALDLSWSNPRIPQVQPSDPWLAVPGGRTLSDRWRGELPTEDPRVSPLAGAWRSSARSPSSAAPATSSTRTHTCCETARKAAGVDIEFHEGPGLVHVYPLLPTRTGEAARSIITKRLTARPSSNGPADNERATRPASNRMP